MAESDPQEELERLRAQVEQLAQQLAEKTTDGSSGAGAGAAAATLGPDAINWEEALETVETHVREHPVGSAIAALAIGLVIGVAISR